MVEVVELVVLEVEDDEREVLVLIDVQMVATLDIDELENVVV